MAPITVEDLTVDIRALDRDALLSDWTWKVGLERLPILVSFIGDAFVQDVRDGTVHHLDTTFGTLEQVAASPDELARRLADLEFVNEHLVPGLFVDLRDAGRTLGPGQVFSWRTPPALGGELVAGNLEPADIAVHFSLTGQIHRQIADLPEGTPIPEIRIEDP